MATEDAEASESTEFAGDEAEETGEGDGATSPADSSGGRQPARAGEYTWAEFMAEHGHGNEVDELYPDRDEGILDREGPGPPQGDDWNAVSFEPADYLGFHPDEIRDQLKTAVDGKTATLYEAYSRRAEPDRTHIARGWYTWEHFKREYYYDEDGNPPTSDGDVVPFDGEEYLGWNPEATDDRLETATGIANALAGVVDERTVTTLNQFGESELRVFDDITEADVEAFDEDEFFTDENGNTTLVNRYDLEKSVPEDKKSHFLEQERYWVNKPYAYIVIFHSTKENEKKYYVIEPYTNEIETELSEFLEGKLRTAIKYSDDDVVVEGSVEDRAGVIEREARRLLKRYDLFEDSGASSDGDGGLLSSIGLDSLLGNGDESAVENDGLDGIEVRPEPVVLEEDSETLTEYQVEKLLYYLKRDFIGYERIDPIKHDTVNVEDLGVDGYNRPVFVNHSTYEWVISNVYHGEDELDDFVVKMAQRSGKGISKRNPQVDATLRDGSRAQLTLGEEVSDHGTNYTIRQFKEVPFTPVDQISWNTFSLEEMAFLWLSIENNKSMIIAGGTATGKTSLLNAVSLFIPSNEKIVSIEDTREVELPQRNWIASVVRPSFGEDDTGAVDEFDLLEAALRQRPGYIIVGEVRGEEGRDLFQVMSTGHTSYATFHADSVGEVLKRFTTDPINVSKTMFTALDLVSIQTRTRVGGHQVLRNKNLTEINHYDAENDEINVQDVYQWQAETDEFLKMGESNTVEEIMFDRGWSHSRIQEELFKREVILAYLIKNDLNTYAQVAATIQAFINDQENILTLIANGLLEESLEDLREMESVIIDVDQEKEQMAPRPEPSDTTLQQCRDILDRAEDRILEEYRGKEAMGLASALDEEELAAEEEGLLELPEESETEIEFSGELSEDAFETTDLDMESDRDEPLKEPDVEEDDEADEPDTAPAEPADEPDEEGGKPAQSTDEDESSEEDIGLGAEPQPPDAGGDASDEVADSTEGDEEEEEAPDWLFGSDDEPVDIGDESVGESQPEATEATAAHAGASSESESTDGDDDGLAIGETDETSEEDDAGAMAFGGDDGNGDGESSGGMAFGADDSGDAADDTMVFGDETTDADDTEDDGSMTFADADDETDDSDGDGGLAFGADEEEESEG